MGGGKGGGKGKDGGKAKGGNKGKDGKSRRIPGKELQAMDAVPNATSFGRCKFWNSSVGCARGASCRFAHDCWECGKNHKFYEQHIWW